MLILKVFVVKSNARKFKSFIAATPHKYDRFPISTAMEALMCTWKLCDGFLFTHTLWKDIALTG